MRRKAMSYGLRAFVRLVAIGITAGWAITAAMPAHAGDQALRVCAPPAALPFSNRAGQGYENKIAELIGGALRRPIAFVWDAGAIDALAAGRCDVVMAVPARLDTIDTTAPYYSSSYVVVSRAGRGLAIDSMKDARLKTLRIGVEAIDGGRVETPPTRALADRGLVRNLIAYPVPAEASEGPRARMLDDVAHGRIDVAVLWGPVAGYFARRAPVPLTITPITDTDEFSARKRHVQLISFQYDISMGVRKGDSALREALDRVIARDHAAIAKVLGGFGVSMLKLQVASVAPPAQDR